MATLKAVAAGNYKAPASFPVHAILYPDISRGLFQCVGHALCPSVGYLELQKVIPTRPAPATCAGQFKSQAIEKDITILSLTITDTLGR